MGAGGGGRTLKTARAVLRVLRYLAGRPDGVLPVDVAQLLDKSVATATYLLNSLCEEGFARRDPDGRYRLTDHPPPDEPTVRRSAAPPALGDTAEVLHELTGQRTYLATIEDETLVVQEVCGRQGLPQIPGLGAVIRKEAHALALGKAAIAHGAFDGVGGYSERHGLRRFTDQTIAARRRLEADTERVRRDGIAFDVEEFCAGFCCVAAPLIGEGGELRGLVGLSTTTWRFVRERPRLIDAVRQAAGRPTMQTAQGGDGRVPT